MTVRDSVVIHFEGDPEEFIAFLSERIAGTTFNPYVGRETYQIPPGASVKTWKAEAAMRQSIALEQIAKTFSKLDPVLDELEETIKREAQQVCGRAARAASG